MGIPVGVMRLALRGKISATDVWNTSVWFAPLDGTVTIPNTNGGASVVLGQLTTGTQWAAFKSGLLAMIRANGQLSGETLYCYPTGGPTATAIATQDDIAAGTGTVGALPAQVSRVVTLLTGVAGRSYRGRMYFPATALACGATDLQFTDNGATLLTQLDGWLAMQSAVNKWQAVVVSSARSAKTNVQSFKTDSLPDIQRRRVNRTPPTTTRTQVF
jgi:hypothetical protein